eukprot:jgi/Ulvmu1/4372/UM002_0097.1
MGHKIVVAVDGAESLRALDYAAKHLLQQSTSRLHIVTVLPPVNHTMAPSAPIATAGAVEAISSAWHAQQQADQAHAARLLSQAEEMCKDRGIPIDIISYHTLPAGGGASGVAESLVQHCRLIEDPVLVMCSRGLGSIKKAALSLVGLGSVSDYCIARASYATVIVKGPAAGEQQDEAPAKRYKVCVCVDDSDNCLAALDFAATNFLPDKNVELHVVSVAAATTFPVVDDTTFAMASVQAKQMEEEKAVALKNAESSCAKAIDVLLKRGAPESQLFWKALQPKGGAGGAGHPLVQYCEENAMDTCCVGSHGFGAFMKGLRALVGLGSVSDYCVKHMPCCVCLVRPRGTIVANGHEQAAPQRDAPEEEEEHRHTE